MSEIYRAMSVALVSQKSEKVNLTLLDMKYERASIRLCSTTKNPELKSRDKNFESFKIFMISKWFKAYIPIKVWSSSHRTLVHVATVPDYG